MAYRCIMVESKAHLSVRNRQLVIAGDSERTVPLEDIAALLVESVQSTATFSALAAAAQHGIAVIVCDQSHLPAGVLLPFAQHSRHLQVVMRQLGMTQPTRNRLWKQVVQCKIANQAECLRISGHQEAADALFALSKQVQTGDKGYLEGVAAAQYFAALFGKGFRRGAENGINAALNYGYSLFRAATARALAVYGLLLCTGIQHHSELNTMNLADDMMEPFRPIVDLYVAHHVSEDEILTPLSKRALFSLLACDVLSGTQHHSAHYAVERLVQSFVGATECPRCAKLTLPTLLPLQPHRYE